MVTKLKNNSEYLEYIRNGMKENFSNWKESTASCLGEPNNNFQISFVKELYKIEFIKDKGLLESNIYFNNELIRLGYLRYNEILEKIPIQENRWRLSVCTELIDFYLDFLKSYFFRKE